MGKPGNQGSQAFVPPAPNPAVNVAQVEADFQRMFDMCVAKRVAGVAAVLGVNAEVAEAIVLQELQKPLHGLWALLNLLLDLSP